MSKGVANTQSLQPYAVTLQSLGYDFVIRYYSNTDPAKNLSPGEVQALSEAGLGIVPVWDSGASGNSAYFTFENGRSDGENALACAIAVGQPQETPIYFVVDYNATQADINGGITNYFLGVQKALNSADGFSLYGIGVYGSGLVCSLLPSSIGDISGSTYTWLADSKDWNNNNFINYNIRQYHWQLSYPPEKLAFDINFSPNDNPGSFSLI